MNRGEFLGGAFAVVCAGLCMVGSLDAAPRPYLTGGVSDERTDEPVRPTPEHMRYQEREILGLVCRGPNTYCTKHPAPELLV